MNDAHDLICRLADALTQHVDPQSPNLNHDLIAEARAYLATGGWIKCSDRMPPDRDDTVLIWHPEDGLAPCWAMALEAAEATHWMPMPPPPEDAP